MRHEDVDTMNGRRTPRGLLSIGRIAGVPIALHYTWAIIAALIALSLATRFRLEHADWSTAVVWTAALVTGALFFGGLVLHELAHALTARRAGLPLRSITLFAFGGLAHLPREPQTARQEFWIAIAGPLTSVALGGLCLAAARALGWDGAEPATPVLAVLVWLGYINIVLAIFNLIPGYPLDGGRVLRAIAWRATGDRDRATRIAARGGQLVGWLLITYGVFGAFAGGGFGSLWLAFIGWFLLGAAQQAYLDTELRSRLRGVRVGDIMSGDCRTVDGRLSVREFVDEYMLKSGRRCFIVEQDGDSKGLVTPAEVRHLPRERWPAVSVDAIMRPLPALKTITAEAPVSQALELMASEDVNQLPVMSDGHITGTLSRADVLRVLSTGRELGEERLSA
jgi:Zn-dependent protease/predicted transcriptional regulator